MVLTTRLLAAVVLLAAIGCCTHNQQLLTLAETNRAHLNTVRLGQTLVEVEKIMGPPERRAARLRFDGISIEEWSYVTDPVRRSDALILFVGGKVQEIQAAPWGEREGESEAER